MNGTTANNIALSSKYIAKKKKKSWDEYNKAMALFGLPKKEERK